MNVPNSKIISPTLHLYYYVLCNSMNERLERQQERWQTFNNNLQKIASHLTSCTGINAQEFIRLVPLESEFSIAPSNSILDFDNVLNYGT